MKTNRDYFSWSQYYTWKSSKLQFYKRYVLGEEGPKLTQFEKGKEFADYKETGEIPHYVTDPLLAQVAEAVHSLEIMENELRVEIGDYKLLAYLDTCDADLTEFAEYKTGKNEWNQGLVNKHEQLDFYALCCYIKSNETIIPKCTLYWIETEEIILPDGSEELRYTGHVESFKRVFTEDDMVNMMTKVVAALKEIEAYEHVEVELKNNLVNRYIELDTLLKETKDEMETIKLEVKNYLINNHAKYGVTENGRFSLSERKSYVFSPELSEKEKEYKLEIDKLKKTEKDNGTAKEAISTSLLFKLVK
jgi:hypothetical protein